MSGIKRLLCLLLAVVLLAGFVPPSTDAAGTVVFTAVNDTLLPLADETMPFSAGGVLYVASMAFDGTDLGIFYSRSRDKNTAVLYKKRSVIIFDLAAGTIETNSGESFSGAAIVRGDVVFLPVDVMCRYFGFEYSYTRVSYGYLLRIKSDTVVLSDDVFIDAATAPMAQRYNRYGNTPEQAEAAPEAPPAPPPPAPDTTQRTAYLVVASTDPEKTAPLLERFSGGCVTCLFAPDGFDGADELLRRLASGEGTIALRADASAGAESAVEQIEAGNRALWAAANTKTRLVWLDGASDETARRVAAAGYCPIRGALNLGGSGMSASRMSARILAAADARRGSCCVFLGADAEITGNLGALLNSLSEGRCTLARLNEVTVQ